jgi:hypothetical protein
MYAMRRLAAWTGAGARIGMAVLTDAQRLFIEAPDGIKPLLAQAIDQV